jgi:HEAT repeat protein
VADKCELVIHSVEDFIRLDEEDELRARWARVDEYVWRQLLEDGYPKSSILLNKQLPRAILEILARDSDALVRAEVASKRAAAPLLDLLAKDESAMVRSSVACNAKATPAVLEGLTNDTEPVVANAARARLGLPFVPEPVPGVTRVIGGWDDDSDEP